VRLLRKVRSKGSGDIALGEGVTLAGTDVPLGLIVYPDAQLVIGDHTFINCGSSISTLICRHATNRGADLIVMGCYGHARLREMVFGGATRHLLRHMPVPVLFSH
jgi:nucleotide-binding universal stress UspA family protein